MLRVTRHTSTGDTRTERALITRCYLTDTVRRDAGANIIIKRYSCNPTISFQFKISNTSAQFVLVRAPPTGLRRTLRYSDIVGNCVVYLILNSRIVHR